MSVQHDPRATGRDTDVSRIELRIIRFYGLQRLVSLYNDGTGFFRECSSLRPRGNSHVDPSSPTPDARPELSMADGLAELH